MSINVDRAIPEFKRKFDPHAQIVGSVQGEESAICRILESEKRNYYINYITEFFHHFARICKAPNAGEGESISKPQLFDALRREDGNRKKSWIIVVKPINYTPGRIPSFNNDVRYFGQTARVWYQYFLDNHHAENTPKGRSTPNISIPANLLVNMKEGFNLT